MRLLHYTWNNGEDLFQGVETIGYTANVTIITQKANDQSLSFIVIYFFHCQNILYENFFHNDKQRDPT